MCRSFCDFVPDVMFDNLFPDAAQMCRSFCDFVPDVLFPFKSVSVPDVLFQIDLSQM